MEVLHKSSVGYDMSTTNNFILCIKEHKVAKEALSNAVYYTSRWSCGTVYIELSVDSVTLHAT